MDRLGQEGGQPQKQPRYAPIFVAASLTGLFTQRHVFHDPSNVVVQRFYGGRPDTLYNGLNVELSNNLTIVRRPGTVAISDSYASLPDNIFQWFDNSGNISTLVDTTTNVYLENWGVSKTSILTKSAGAGQGFFVASGNVVYYGNGVDLIKYTPGNPNGLTWNWGIAAPMAAPKVTTVPSGSSAVAWLASTFYSTMGLLVDSNNNIQFLVSVTQNGNTGTTGLTGNGSPAFSNLTGGTVVDNTVTWKCKGQLGLWTPGKTWAVFAPIYDPNSNGIYVAFFGGTSGSIAPNFVPTFNTHTTDSGGVEWQYIGPPALWQPSTVYNSFWEFSNEMVCEPILPTVANLTNVTQPIFVQTANDATVGHNNSPGTSGTGYSPVWATTPGQQTADNQLLWTCLGSKTWAANTNYSGWALGASLFSALVDGNGNFQVCVATGQSQATTPYNGWLKSTSFATNAIIAVQNPASATGWTAFKNLGGTATSGSSQPTWDFTTGHTTTDGGITWTSQGATTAGVPVWGQTYGSTTNDGSTAWVNVGSAANSTWSTGVKWYLPAVGFQPPSLQTPYGGAAVIGSSYVQFCTQSGLSQNPGPPSWPTTVGSTVTDGTVIWTTTAAYTGRGITWTKGHVYGFSFKCRTATDPYVTTSLLNFGSLNTAAALAPLGNVPGLTAALGAYAGGGTGAVSTCSPVFTISTPEAASSVNTISGLGSTDPQVDTIVIWRDADGGGVDNMFELVEIPAPKPVGGNAQPWSFQDFLPDIASTVGGINYPGLDVLSPAPIADINDPPPAGFRPLCNQLHFSRIWGAVGNSVLFSTGPDTNVGNPNEAFNPTNEYTFKSNVQTCIHSPVGLICPTTTDFECIYGGPATDTFYSTILFRGIGMASPNSWDQLGNDIYFVSPDLQFWSLTPSLQLARLGFPVGNLLQSSFTPASIYVAAIESGTENAIFISGYNVGPSGSGWIRVNPHQVGADISGENAMAWSPVATFNQGCGMVQTILLSSGGKYLPFIVMGAGTTGQPIFKRSPGTFTDGGSAYSAWFEIGAVTMVEPGQRAAVKFLEFDFTAVGTQPSVSYVIDDPSASPTWLALSSHVFDPPIVYAGTNITPNYWPDRFYLSQQQGVALGRRIRMKVDFGNADTVQNELISWAIWGKKYSE